MTGGRSALVGRKMNGIWVEPQGLKCYAVGSREGFFKGFVFAHSRTLAGIKVKSLSDDYKVLGFGWSVSPGSGL